MGMDGLRRLDMAEAVRGSQVAVLIALLSVLVVCGFGSWLFLCLAGRLLGG